jgi:hypothetical protein
MHTEHPAFVLPRQLGPSWDGGWWFLPKPTMPSADIVMEEFKKIKPNRKPGDSIVAYRLVGEHYSQKLVHPTLGPIKIWSRQYITRIEGIDGPINYGFNRIIYVRDDQSK